MIRKTVTRLRTVVSWLLAVAMLLGCASVAAAEDAVESGSMAGKAAVRTILLYDCGSNLETDYGMATWNLCQVLAAEIPETVNFVVLTGGSDAWQTESEYLEGAEGVCLDGKNEIWVCSGKNAANAENGHGKMTLQTDTPDQIATALLSEGETLRGFIDYAAQKYPAQKYDLILWDHGGGPQYGFGMDEHDPNDGIMSVGAIAKALKASRVDHFDIVNFDACLMSSVEIVASLSEYADYLILSAETSPGYGQEYTTWLNALAKDPAMNGFDLGRIVVDAYVAFYENPETDGYGQAGTLAAIDTKAFRERMMPHLTELARIMDRELTTVGEYNLLLNYQDEYRSQAAAYPYYDEDLLDIGSFVGHLGIGMSELDNTMGIDIATMTNAYTETAAAILAILEDMDNSGDDVIYFKATGNTTVPVTAKVAYARNSEGALERVEQMSPTGMSIFFSPVGYNAMIYMQAMNEMLEAAEDEGVRQMLKALETVSLRFLLTTAAGTRVNSLRDQGVENIYYKTVRDSWQKPRELSDNEIDLYEDTMKLGYGVDIKTMTASDWNAYVADVIQWLDGNTDVNTDTWLALLVAQQSSMALDKNETKAVALDLNGDGGMDASRVTLPVPLSLIRSVSLSVDYPLFEEFYFPIGKINGTPVTDEAALLYNEYESMDYSVQELYAAKTCAFDVPVTLDKWYEILGADGVGHMISITDMDSVRTNELKIPVYIEFAETDEEGYQEGASGYLIYRDGHFTGFLDGYSPDPIISLNNRKFDGARVHPAIAIPFIGTINLFIPINMEDGGISFGEDRTDDRGMKIVMTDLGEITALQDKPARISVVATDIYGYDHDLSGAIEMARAEADQGTILRSIEKATVDNAELTYNRKRQKPQFTVKIGGEELVEGQDYLVGGSEMFRAGTQDYILVGIGDYVGVARGICTMAQAVSTVEAAAEVAPDEIAGADMAILTVNTPAHPENIAFDFTGTAENLRQYLETGDDGRSVILKQGAEAGSYTVKVTVTGGAEDTYTEIEGISYTVEVK